MVRRARLLDGGGGGLDVLGAVVGSLGPSAEDDVHILQRRSACAVARRGEGEAYLVTTRLDDRSETLLGDTHEGVRI